MWLGKGAKLMATYLYETKEPLPYEGFSLSNADKNNMVSCKLDMNSPAHVYDSVFKDNHGFLGNPDSFEHDSPRGYVYESDHLLSKDELSKLPAGTRFVLPSKEYETCKKLRDITLTVHNLPTVAYPKDEVFTIAPDEKNPARVFECYVWLKQEERANGITAKDSYPKIFRKRQLAWNYKGTPVEDPITYITMQGEFPKLPNPSSEKTQLLYDLAEKWVSHQTYTSCICDSDILRYPIEKDKNYDAEQLLSRMKFDRAHSNKDTLARACRFYEDAALVTCYNAENTPEGQEAFAKAMLYKMAKDGVSPKRMKDIMLSERNEGVMNKGMDLLEQDKTFRKELHALRQTAKKQEPIR